MEVVRTYLVSTTLPVDSANIESPFHQHVFLGEGHAQSERKIWGGDRCCSQPLPTPTWYVNPTGN